MGIEKTEVLFRKSGYHYGNSWIETLIISFEGEEFSKNIKLGRGTILSQVIEKYILKTKFLFGSSRIQLRKRLDEEQVKLLRAMLQVGTINWKLGRLL